jgi:hypothetical protein
MVELYLHSHVCVHGAVLDYITKRRDSFACMLETIDLRDILLNKS